MLFPHWKKRTGKRAERRGEKKGEKLNQKWMRARSLPPKRPPEFLPTHRRCPLPGKNTLIAIPHPPPQPPISCLQPTPQAPGSSCPLRPRPTSGSQPHPVLAQRQESLSRPLAQINPFSSSYFEQNTRAGSQAPAPGTLHQRSAGHPLKTHSFKGHDGNPQWGFELVEAWMGICTELGFHTQAAGPGPAP